MTLAAADFAAVQQLLYPPGRAYGRPPAPGLAGLAAGIADSIAAFDARSDQLYQVERFPTRTFEMLPDWEFDYGLPDPCTPLVASVAQRMAALRGKIVATGGASRPYFTAVAAALGYAITITEFRPARYGRPNYGQPRYGVDWAHAWRVTSQTSHRAPAQYGPHRSGERYETIEPNSVLECVLGRLKPAHTVLQFAYTA